MELYIDGPNVNLDELDNELLTQALDPHSTSYPGAIEPPVLEQIVDELGRVDQFINSRALTGGLGEAAEYWFARRAMLLAAVAARIN